jgi:hypothetical protein
MPHVIVDVDEGCGMRQESVRYKFIRDYNMPCYNHGFSCASGSSAHLRAARATGFVAAEFAPSDPLPEPLRIALAPIPIGVVHPITQRVTIPMHAGYGMPMQMATPVATPVAATPTVTRIPYPAQAYAAQAYPAQAQRPQLCAPPIAQAAYPQGQQQYVSVPSRQIVAPFNGC